MPVNSPVGGQSPRSGSATRAGLLLVVLGVVTLAAMIFMGRNHPTLGTPASLPAKTAQKEPTQPAEASTSPGEQSKATLAADTNSAEAQLVSQLLNTSLPLKTRRQAARALGKLGTDNSISALKTALRDGSPYLKAAIGEGLGESPHHEARTLLIDMINGNDPTAARGAIRGMALRGDAEAADILSNILFNDKKSADLRIEAALSLGDIQQASALSALVRATGEIRDPEIVEQVLEGLGRRPWPETEKFFNEYLATPGISAESKVAALEALGNSTGDISALALKYATDPDPEIRAAAAWALSATETQNDIGPQLLDLLKNESSPDVRTRIYEALGGQENYDAMAVLDRVQKETDLATRQAGLAVLAALCRSKSSPELLAFFAQTAVPELENLALASADPQDRLNSVMSLRRASTPEAFTALQQIAQQSTDKNIIAAAMAGLKVGLRK